MNQAHIRRWSVLVLMPIAVSCGESSTSGRTDSEPTELHEVGGNDQEGVVELPLPDSLRVRVTDRNGKGISNVQVLFSPTSGSGSVVPASVSTDAHGYAAASWILGQRSGIATAEARVPVLPSARIEFRSTAHAQGYPVGARGDTIAFGDGKVQLYVPPGALNGSVVLTIAQASADNPKPFLMWQSIHQFGPSEITFSRPVTLTLRYDETSVPGGILPSDLRLFRYDGRDWTEVHGSRVDANAKTVQAEISGFSQYAVGATRGALPVATVLSPVIGELEQTAAPVCCQPPKRNGVWQFWQRGGFGHGPGGGVHRADDTFAWDANLQLPGNPDADRGQDVYAVYPGLVVGFRATINGPPSSGKSGEILIQHETDGVVWYSGYLHMGPVLVVIGDQVNTNTVVGRISNVSDNYPNMDNHLHFAVYLGENRRAGLYSVDAQLEVRHPTPPPVLSNIAANPTPPVESQPFTFTIQGSGFDPAVAEVAFLGPGCATPMACVIPNSVLTAKTATRLVGPAVLDNVGSYTAHVRNGPSGTPSNGGGLTVVPRSSTAPVVGATISVGGFHTCGLSPTGAAYCWGENRYGALGDGTTTNRLVPTAVAGGRTFSAISAGGSHTCALTSDGAAFCWGSPSGLGTGDTTRSLVPTAVAGGLTFASIAAAAGHTCALTATGTAYCWGSNIFGELGDGTSTQRWMPTAVVGGLTFASISARGGHTCGLTAAGVAYCWGYGVSGQLGSGSAGNRPIPTAVVGGLTFAMISAAGAHTCALTAVSEAYCWGLNEDGQLGDGSQVNRLTPTQVLGKMPFVAISAWGQHTCALSPVGAAYCWGANSAGRLGDGTTIGRLTPTAVVGGLTFSTMSAGWMHSCALTATGVVYCWGTNWYGALGDGTTANRDVPTPVLDWTNLVPMR